MRGLIFLMILGFINCSTLFFKPETRVGPICEWRKEKKERLEQNKQSENGNRKNNQTQQTIIEYPDLELIEHRPFMEGTKIYKLQGKIQEYAKTLNELIDIEVVSVDITKIKKILLDRMDSVHLSLADVYEKQGDMYYGAYNFSKAMEAYMDSIDTIKEIYSEKVQKSHREKLDKKIKLTRETGENFLQNKIKTYVDQANYLYLDDQNDKAKDAMKLARDELYKTIFFNPKTIFLFNEQAKIMKLDEFQEGFCTTIFKRENYDSSKKQLKLKVTLPESFTTRSGLKFTKLVRKDGKSVYVSEIIRLDKEDSWYFARDYAERLNKEENCSDCYQLPEFADIENVKGKYYEGTWLKSWSPAPFGMTVGNFYLGAYTFDFFHDVITHPLTWQSYIYPISPDGVYFSGGTWSSDGRIIRSASRISYVKGFLLIRILS
jgi:hypothetical protein